MARPFGGGRLPPNDCLPILPRPIGPGPRQTSFMPRSSPPASSTLSGTAPTACGTRGTTLGTAAPRAPPTCCSRRSTTSDPTTPTGASLDCPLLLLRLGLGLALLLALTRRRRRARRADAVPCSPQPAPHAWAEGGRSPGARASDSPRLPPRAAAALQGPAGRAGPHLFGDPRRGVLLGARAAAPRHHPVGARRAEGWAGGGCGGEVAALDACSAGPVLPRTWRQQAGPAAVPRPGLALCVCPLPTGRSTGAAWTPTTPPSRATGWTFGGALGMGCGGGRRRPGLPPAPSGAVLARTRPQPRAPAPAPAPHSYHPPRSLLYCPPPVASPPRSDNVTHPQFEPTGFLRKLGGHPCHDPTKVMPTTGALAGHGSRSAAAAAACASRACFQKGMPAARTPPPPALTCWSHFITVLHPKQDLVVPSMKTPEDWRASPLAGAPTRNRTWLAFHRGRVRGGLGYPPAPADCGACLAALADCGCFCFQLAPAWLHLAFSAGLAPVQAQGLVHLRGCTCHPPLLLCFALRRCRRRTLCTRAACASAWPTRRATASGWSATASRSESACVHGRGGVYPGGQGRAFGGQAAWRPLHLAGCCPFKRPSRDRAPPPPPPPHHPPPPGAGAAPARRRRATTPSCWPAPCSAWCCRATGGRPASRTRCCTGEGQRLGRRLGWAGWVAGWAGGWAGGWVARCCWRADARGRSGGQGVAAGPLRGAAQQRGGLRARAAAHPPLPCAPLRASAHPCLQLHPCGDHGPSGPAL